MNSLLVQLSKNELSILLSALNYLSTREEKQLHHEYGSILRLYNKLEKQLKATRKALKKKALKLIDAEVRCRRLEVLIENRYWERRQKEKV